MRNKQKGFSLIELLIVVAIILIIAAIAIPNLLRSRMAANEASAVASLRTVNTSEVIYSSTYNVGFSANLTSLADGGAPAAVGSSCLIDASLATGSKSGYNFAYAATAVGGVNATYTVNGDPQSVGSTGQRHFFTNQTNVIRVNTAAVAAATDPAL